MFKVDHSYSSSGASTCYSEVDIDRNLEEDSDEDDAFISFTTTESKCEELFQCGLECKIQGDFEQSLSYFLECLKSMQDCQYFAKLPQTLHHLTGLYKSLVQCDTATDYAEAEKLFYEAVETQKTKEGESKQKTKRRPFSKKSKPATSYTECNPAEYGNLLIKKAQEFDSLAHTCAEERKFKLALEYMKKTIRIKLCVYGENHPLTLGSQKYLSELYRACNETIHQPGGVNLQSGNQQEGDLSDAAVGGGVNGSTTSVQGVGAQVDMSTTIKCGILQRSNGKLLNASQDTPLSATMAETEVCEKNSSMHSNVTKDGETVDYSQQQHDCLQECKNSIHDISRLLEDKVSEDKVPEDTLHKDKEQNSSTITVQAVQEGMLCCPPLPAESNVCTGVTSNLSKLKPPPMCVNLDLHNGSKEGMESSRCLPLWVLLLPGFLALVTYMLYYH